MNEIIRKFTSRKFIAAAATFVGALLVALNVEEGTIQLIATIATIVAPLFYIAVEGYLDGKNIGTNYIPTLADTIHDLIDVYEMEKGETGLTNFLQDIAKVIAANFEVNENDGD